MSPADPEFLVAQKGALRQIMRARREEAGRTQPTAALALRDRFLASFSLPPSCLVASYRPFRNEIDSEPLAEALFALGHRLCLPVLSDKEKPLL
ncbi:MAG: hypothetical protein HGA90_01880, partial [Alphaproteobacteria bacterium]|nr:hypothetical protein [Alphaproteobacteria bacterium]